MANNSYFKNKYFLSTWTMYDKKEEPCGMDGDMINTLYLKGQSLQVLNSMHSL